MQIHADNTKENEEIEPRKTRKRFFYVHSFSL